MTGLFSQFILCHPSRLLALLMGACVAAAWVVTERILEPASLIISLLLALAMPLALLFPRQAFLSLLVIRNLVDIFSDTPLLSLGGFAFNLSSLLGLLMIAWGLWYFFRYWPIPTYRGNVALILFILTAGMSAFGSLQPIRSIQEFIKFTNLALVFVFAYDYVRTRQDFHTLLSVLGISIVAPAVLGTVQLLTGTGLSTDIQNRIFGTYGHPNVFAFALGLSINIWIVLIMLKNCARSPTSSRTSHAVVRVTKFTGRIPPWFIFSLLSILLLFTYTRGAWIGLTVSLALLGFRYARKTILASVSIIALMWLSFPAINHTVERATGFSLAHSQLVRRFSTDEDETSSWQWRLRSWQEVSVRFHDMPLFGYGIGTFVRIRENTASYAHDLMLEAHNDYLRLALEMGFVGLIGYVLFLLSILIRCLRASWSLSDPTVRKACFTTAAVTVAFLVMSISDNILHATAVDWLWWALMGGTCALITVESLQNKLAKTSL
ncbi:hypothetical protein A2753_00040 [Candidatus Uhrbacteria bacterium RIFCSPHIGHO2_01_FULL_47_11]|nr:MAG: hypothetical protein A2753_00040 [Candidatus Uhrbacteria bacterium RIFCSPHIGHO2_01_FULL_47_11]